MPSALRVCEVKAALASSEKSWSMPRRLIEMRLTFRFRFSFENVWVERVIPIL